MISAQSSRAPVTRPPALATPGTMPIFSDRTFALAGKKFRA
jgi:hypothetical protein